MADRSNIEWTDASWTPIRARNLRTGKVGWHREHATPGCERCYSEGMNRRLGTGLPFKPGHRKDVEIFLDENMLLQPLKWQRPRMVFVCSMTDLFADFVTDEMIDRVFAVMALAPQHTFQVLTKRADRMREYLSDPDVARRVYLIACEMAVEDALNVVLIVPGLDNTSAPPGPRVHVGVWPLPNVWLGVSAEDQRRADERIPDLLATPASVRWVSAEPLLASIDFEGIEFQDGYLDALRGDCWGGSATGAFASGLSWVVVGGESGAGARPMHPDWARSIRDQCAAAGVAFFFKQWGQWVTEDQSPENIVLPSSSRGHWATRDDEGAWGGDLTQVYNVGKKAAGRLLDGIEHNEMPAVRA